MNEPLTHREAELQQELELLRNRLRDAPLGGDGSHWSGCELVHIDCARLAIERLREALADDPSKWSFWTLATVARALLAADYPADVFVSDGTTGDPGPRFIGHLRAALAVLP